MRFLNRAFWILPLLAAAAPVCAQSRLRWELPCAITGEDGKAIAPPVESRVCDYILANNMRARETFNGISPEGQTGFLKTESRNAEQAWHKFNQRKETLLNETDPRLAKAGAPGERLKTLLAFKERVNKEGVGIAMPFGAGKPYLKEFEARIKDLDSIAKMEERTTKSKASIAKERLEKAPEKARAAKVDTMFTGAARGSREPLNPAAAAAPQAASGSLAGGGLKDGGARRAESTYGAAKAPPPLLPAKIGALKVDDLRKRGYSDANIADLEKGVTAASGAVDRLHNKYPSNVAAAYGNGTMTNIEDSAKWAFSRGDYKLNRGCISHQQTTLAAAPPDGSMDYKPVVVGWGMEHHAVVAYPKGTDWMKTGVVLDAWKTQDAKPEKMTYSIDAWKSTFGGLGLLSGARIEEP